MCSLAFTWKQFDRKCLSSQDINDKIHNISLKNKFLKLQSHLPGTNELTHCGLVAPYADIDMGQPGSGNGLLPDGTKPLPEPMLTYHKWGPVKITWGQFHNGRLSHQSVKLAWKLISVISFKFPRGQWVKASQVHHYHCHVRWWLGLAPWGPFH